MAIAFRSSNVATGQAVSSVSVTKPAGTASGDRLIAVGTISGSSLILTAPAGWTEIYTSSNPNSFKLSIWELFAGGGEPASYSFTTSQGDDLENQVALGMAAYSGASSGTSSTPGTGNTGTANFPNGNATCLTVSAPNGTEMLLAIVMGHNNAQNGGYTPSSTPPSGMTERFDIGISTNRTDPPHGMAYVYLADLLLSSGGSTGDKIAVVSTGLGNNVDWNAVNVLIPSPAGGPRMIL